MIPTELSITELADIIRKTRNQAKYMVSRGVFGMPIQREKDAKIYVSAKEVERLYPEEWRLFVFDKENEKYRKSGKGRR